MKRGVDKPDCLGCGKPMTFIHADHFVKKDVYNLDFSCNFCKATLTEKGVKF